MRWLKLRALRRIGNRNDLRSTRPAPALVWQDEFDGQKGATFDHAKWVADTGGGGFGNQEREFYTTRTENVALDGDGHLVITALAEPASTSYRCWYGSCRYTSARLKTQGLFPWTYGRFEARIRLPRGQGVWPAFWMLGADIDTVGWPACGEIDIMENIGREPTHRPRHDPWARLFGRRDGIGGSLLAAERRPSPTTFTSSRSSGSQTPFAGTSTARSTTKCTPPTIPSGTHWVFDHPFFLILNLAIGGAWPGDPDASTSLPQQIVVDYVRVYK